MMVTVDNNVATALFISSSVSAFMVGFYFGRTS